MEPAHATHELRDRRILVYMEPGRDAPIPEGKRITMDHVPKVIQHVLSVRGRLFVASGPSPFRLFATLA